MIKNHLAKRAGIQMAIPNFVIDSELFSLFSSKNNNLNLIKRHFQGDPIYGNREVTIKEEICFHEVLKKMKEYKCAIAWNESIKKEYLEIAKDCDEIAKKKFLRMIATRSYWDKNNEILTNGLEEKFKGTPLEEKTHYLNATRQCKDYRVLVSTGKCTKEYLNNEGELLDFDVDCKSICELKHCLEKNNSNILVGTINKDNNEEKVFDFVIDPELFLLFSPTKNTLDCIKRHTNGEILNEDDEKSVREAKSFLEILYKIEEQKCLVARNEFTKKEYAEKIKTCDPSYKRKFHRIMSTISYWHDNDETLTKKDREILRNTILEEKAHYIDAARQCKDYQVIVSTREHTEKYFRHYEKLLELEVNCESICEFKDSLVRELIQPLHNSNKISEEDKDQMLMFLKTIAYRFDSKETLLDKLDKLNKIITLQPNLGGFGFNGNAIIELFLKNRKKE